MKPRVSGESFPGRCCWLAGLGMFPFQVLGRSWAEIASVISGRWGDFFSGSELQSAGLAAEKLTIAGVRVQKRQLFPLELGHKNSNRTRLAVPALTVPRLSPVAPPSLQAE